VEPETAPFVRGILLLLPFQAAAVNGWLNLAGAALAVALVFYELKGREVSRVRA